MGGAAFGVFGIYLNRRIPSCARSGSAETNVFGPGVYAAIKPRIEVEPGIAIEV